MRIFIERTLVVMAALLAGAWLVWMSGPLLAADGTTGLSLIQARIGFMGAMALTIVLTLPVLALATLAAVRVSVPAGCFLLGGALLLLARYGGDGQGVFWQAAQPGAAGLPAFYGWLLLEMLFWVLWLEVALLVMFVARRRWGQDEKVLPETDAWRLTITAVPDRPEANAWLAGLLAAAVGAVGIWLLMDQTSIGQMTGITIMVFALGIMAARSLRPHRHPWLALSSPALVGLIGYGLMLVLAGESTRAVLARWYRDELPGMGMMLPVFYVSAGLLGVAVGWGLSHHSVHKPGEIPDDGQQADR